MDSEPINKRFMFGSLYIFLITGAIVLMTSSILTYLMQHYQLNYDQGGLLLSLLAVGSVMSNFLSGALAIRIGRKPALMLAAVCYLVGYGGLSLLPPLPVLYLLMLITGLGWGTFNNLINFLLTLAARGDSRKIILGHTSYSAGALLAPLLVGLFVGLGLTWQIPVAIIAGLSLLMILIILIMPIPEVNLPRGHKTKISLAFLRKWRFYLYVLLFFTYVGVEAGFYGWIVSYLTTLRNFNDPDAQVLLSMLWVMILVGRVAFVFFGKRLPKALFLLFEACGVLIGALLLIIAEQPILLTVAVIFTGLSLSSFYGMIISNASELLTESTLASGLMLSFGGLGATVIPLLIGILASQYGLMSGLIFLAAMAGGLLLLTTINFAARRQNEQRTTSNEQLL